MKILLLEDDLILNELIQVNQAIKEDAHVLEALFEVWNVEVALLVMRLHHVI